MASFFTVPASEELCAESSTREPRNPMLTWAFVQAMQAIGKRAVFLGLRNGANSASGCPAFVRKGRLNRTLEIPSLPPIAAPEQFWDGLFHYLRQNRISNLTVDTFASEGAIVPPLPGESRRRKRWEFVLPLATADLMAHFGTLHRRLVRRAEKAGLSIHRTRDIAACAEHQRVSDASLERRRSRGEDIHGVEVRLMAAMLQSGAAELFQAKRGEAVVSSIVVMRSPRAGYLQASGTDPDGMKVGASHFLNYSIARTLQAEGCEVYNLGGVDDLSSGLAQYKSHFGAREVALEAAEAFVGSSWRRYATSAISAVRQWQSSSG